MNVFDLKIGFKCNNNCRHCVVANKRESGVLSVLRLNQIINNLDKDIDAVQVTGGEPSIYPYLPTILKTCKNKGLYVIVQSNGTGFADEEFCRECLPMIDHLHMAIHSSNPEVHDNIVQSRGMWEKTMKGFKNALKYDGVKLTTQTVVSKYNIATVYDTFKMIQEIAPGTMMSFTYPHMMGNAWNYREDVCFRYYDYKDEIQRILKDFHSYMFVESIPPCYLHPYEDVINNSLENDLLHPEDARRGVDFSESFNQKDYNYLDIINRKKAPKCKECIYNSRCVGVWKEYIELFKNNLDLYPILKNKE